MVPEADALNEDSGLVTHIDRMPRSPEVDVSDHAL